jgi:hypothetical protein
MYSNVFYFKKISAIGGTEQFLYEIAKKYNKYDITIFYDEADKEQLNRLRKLVRVKKRTGEKIECEKAFLNFNIDMIDDLIAKEIIFVSHANYTLLHKELGGYIPPVNNPKINKIIGVSKFATDRMNEYLKEIGSNLVATKCYNPLTLEEKKKVPILVTASRLDDKTKGGKRVNKLIEALDDYCKKNKRNYLFLIFSNPINYIKSKNVIMMGRRLDVRDFISKADFLVQLSRRHRNLWLFNK